MRPRDTSFSIPQVLVLAFATVVAVSTIRPACAFLVQPVIGIRNRHGVRDAIRQSTGERRRAGDVRIGSTSSADNDVETMDDAALLRHVKKSQLVDLCEQLDLPSRGTKQTLLLRLREHASQQVDKERKRRLDFAARVEEGYNEDTKEKHEIVSDDVGYGDDEEDEVFFYLPTLDGTNSSAKSDAKEKTNKSTPYITGSSLTAPPPPAEPNEDGERVVTVYSTTEQNDLTGVAAAQPGQAMSAGDTLDSLAAEASGSAANRPWDMQNSQKAEATSEELDKAKEAVAELVQTLLSMSGAPAFNSMGEDELVSRKIPSFTTPEGFAGFNPAHVPTDLLIESSQALRAGRGHVLQEVLRQFELQAIGLDGMAGDSIERGGGHYREVSKVRAFLEGYRRSEVRRLARETTAMLLDKLVLEGVEGLDLTLASMTRSSDDTSNHAGELNDSLLDYLNDAIRQQEKKVDRMVSERLELSEELPRDESEPVDELWNVTIEEGQRIESIDPNDPKVKKVLEEEYERSKEEESESLQNSSNTIPSTAPEQLLLLLTLLRERIKAEAAFAPDEKGRNLRLLAYCLKLPTGREREQLILKTLGNSMDRLDSFIELVSSSIDYGESTSHQLQPARTRPLNLTLLKSILELAKDLRKRQAWKASGYK